MIPEALATGRCELRARCAVHRVETGKDGRVTEVQYWDEKGRPQAQRARAVVLCANGAETPRLLLMSSSARFPQGLLNNNGRVGKGLMFNSHSVAHGLFDEPEFRQAFLTGLARHKGLSDLPLSTQPSLDALLDRLAAQVRANLDINRIYQIAGLGG